MEKFLDSLDKHVYWSSWAVNCNITLMSMRPELKLFTQVEIRQT
jgi:hypothetical protein